MNSRKIIVGKEIDGVVYVRADQLNCNVPDRLVAELIGSAQVMVELMGHIAIFRLDESAGVIESEDLGQNTVFLPQKTSAFLRDVADFIDRNYP